MRKVLFYVFIAVFLETAVCSFHNSVFADEYDDNGNDEENESDGGQTEDSDSDDEEDGGDDEQAADNDENDGDDSGEGSDEDSDRPKKKKNRKKSAKAKGAKVEDTKNHVRSIVDGFLKINKRVDPVARDSRTLELKEKSINKRIDGLKEQLDKLSATVGAHRTGDKIGETKTDEPVSPKVEQQVESEVSKAPSEKKKSGKKRRRSRVKRSSSSLYDTVYTVKNIRLPTNATNRYLRGSTISYGNRASSTEYRIKSFGNGSSETIHSHGGRQTTKSGDYLKKSSCSSCGCGR